MLERSVRQLDHIGIAVCDLEQSLVFYKDILRLPFLGFETVEREKVRIAFFELGGSKLELLQATSPDSPIASFIKRRGEGIHHLAFKSEKMEEDFIFMEEKGVQSIGDEPKLGAEGHFIRFLHPKSTHGVLIELCEQAPEHK
ncbi:methylmalonyl-CoA epimerase [Alkalihalobacillus sp. 1P02AB]|uniref:methylmalonyl-CoA epimerase n=1 Tax=Alkalihalobacillus sp. 1P02AB TaxID=3132260 RepID=UPI0039A59039